MTSKLLATQVKKVNKEIVQALKLPDCQSMHRFAAVQEPCDPR
jgi:hypothetical protein